MILEFLAGMMLAGGAVLMLRRFGSPGVQTGISTEGGIFTLRTPSTDGVSRPFQDMTLYSSVLTLYDADGLPLFTLGFRHIQGMIPIQVTPYQARVVLHFEEASRWQILDLQMSMIDSAPLIRKLRQVLPPEHIYTGEILPDTFQPIPARHVTETLQGDVLPDEDVILYFMPPLLVVLRNDKVQARLDTRRIRRVLAVERSAGRLDRLLNRGIPEGLIRLYSMHETAVFALSAYRELAEVIALSAGCQVEYIQRDDKQKNT